MAFDFPSSPTNGQEFTPTPGVTYVYYPPRWTVKPAATAPVTDPLKADITYVDAADAALQTDIDAKVDIAGDTMTGDLVISKNSPELTLDKLVNGQSNRIVGMTNGVERWTMVFGSTATESTGNVGSNFVLNAHNDAGSTMVSALIVDRASGLVTLADEPVNAFGAATKSYVDSHSAASGAVLRIGDTMTGNLQINADPPAFTLNRTAAGSASAAIEGRKLGNRRWSMRLGDASTESGSNAGSDFSIANYNDGGTVIGTAMSINRASGNASFASTLAASQIWVDNPTVATVQYKLSGITRWIMDADGSSLRINNYNSGGGSLGTAVTINNATGQSTFHNTTVHANGPSGGAISLAAAGVPVWQWSGTQILNMTGGLFVPLSLQDGTSGAGNPGAVSILGPFKLSAVAIPSTASAANMFYNGGTTAVQVSTSSRRYKTEVKALSTKDADKLLMLEPITFRSKSPIDDPKQVHLGFIAEDVAEIEPRLVQWGYLPEDWEQPKKPSIEEVQNGKSVPEPRLRKGAKMVPNGVAYDRISVLLVAKLREQEQRIAELEKLIKKRKV